MNLKESQEYANKLKKAEKIQKLREEVVYRLQHFVADVVAICGLRYGTVWVQWNRPSIV